MKVLQQRLQRATKKVTASDITVKKLTDDRDVAHHQLAVAYLDNEELKNESNSLREGIGKLKVQLKKVRKAHESELDNLSKEEAELRQKIDRREKAVHEMGALANEIWNTRNHLANAVSNHRNASNRSRASVSFGQADDSSHQMIPFQTETTIQHSRHASSSKSTRNPSEVVAPRISRRTTTANVSSAQQHFDIFDDIGHTTRQHVADEPTSESAFLSFMEGDEIPKLRGILEEDKAKLAAAARGNDVLKELSNANHAHTTLPRKSSFRDAKSRPKSLQVQHGEERENIQPQVERQPKAYESLQRNGRKGPDRAGFALHSTAGRRASVPNDPTSGFIIDDITLQGLSNPIKSSTERNFANVKTKITVPRPVPVSDRDVPQVDEPTLRPANAPGLALATVLKGLEDEVLSLREQLIKQEAMYNRHDPSLSRRQRKIVYSRIQKLLAALDVKSDQIYSLYDVLEGQKASGQMMQEDEVEVTLHKIGIDPLPFTSGARNPGNELNSETSDVDAFGVADDENYLDDLESNLSGDLSWKGLDPTTTLGSLKGVTVR